MIKVNSMFSLRSMEGECVSQPSFKKLLLAADSNWHRTSLWLMCTEQKPVDRWALNGRYSPHPSYQNSGSFGKAGRSWEIARARSNDNLRKPFFHTQHGSCMYELTVMVTACMKTVPPHARQDPSREKGSGHKIPPEELLAIDSFRAENRYPLRMWSLVVWPCSRAGPIPKRSWATWARSDRGRKLRVGRMKRRGWRGGYGSSWERNVNTLKIHSMKFSKNKSIILKRTMTPPDLI